MTEEEHYYSKKWQAISFECQDYVDKLVANGCDEGVALDRTWDAYDHAARDEGHCSDTRDRAFEMKIRMMAKKGEE